MISNSQAQSKLTNREPEMIKVMAIAESQQQRLAFADTVRSCGFTLVDAIAPKDLEEQDFMDEVDIWLVDSPYDKEVVDIIDNHQPNKVLVGFREAPYLTETQKYGKWQRNLKRKLAEIVNMPKIIEKKIYNKPCRDWTHVVFLGASMGGPAAVKEFMDNLSPELPICLLLAHHFNENMIHTLPRILNRHNNWRCRVIDTSQSLQVGTCLIAPVDRQIVCDSHGRVFLSDKKTWEGRYKPSINTLFKNVSEVYGSNLIGIIFSGMGDDGAMYLEQMQENNSHIWAQEPVSCISPSQPQATINSGYCQFVGTPKQLAEKISRMVSQA